MIVVEELIKTDFVCAANSETTRSSIFR